MIRLLVVDDSPFIRAAVTEMLQSEPGFAVVGAARNGAEALELVARLEPDVVVVDLNMPTMSGAEFLRLQRARRPVRAVVLSSASELEPLAAEAVEAGALEFVRKPGSLANDRVRGVRDELVAKVEAVSRVAAERLQPRPMAPAARRPAAGLRSDRVVLLGLSTGGPHHLRELIGSLREPLPVPVAAVVHMPPGFTESFAERLDALGPQQVLTARENTELQPGRLLLAPAGRHLGFAGGTRLQFAFGRPGELHVPSVDELFRSGAERFGSACLAVVLTGMGSDGTQGAAWVKAAGGQVWAEAESSCVVWGMPRSVGEAGLVDRVLPLERLVDQLYAWLETS